MSSSKSLAGKLARHDAFVALRTIAPVLVVFLVLFLVMGAVSTAVIPDISIFNLEYTHDQLKFRLWAEAMTYPMVIGSVVFGAAVAFVGFRFLMIKMQTTAYLSLPLSRAKIFGVRQAVNLLGIAAVIVVAVGASALLNIIALGAWEGEAEQIGYVALGLVVCAEVGYAIMLLAILLAGTQVEALLFGASLLLAVSVVCWGLNVCMSQLLVGNTAGEYLIGTQVAVGPSLLASFATCNPLLWFVNAAAAHQTFTVMPPDLYAPTNPSYILCISWLFFGGVLLSIDELLFVRRRGEKAGIAGLCIPMTFVFSLIVGLLAFSVVFYLLSGINAAFAIAAGVVCFLLVSILLLRGPLKGVMKATVSWGIMAGETVALLAVVAVVATGAFGWSGTVPAASNVTSATISYTGSPVAFAGTYDSASSSNNGFYASGTVTCTDAESIQLVTAVHQQLANTGSAAFVTDSSDFSNTVVSYDVQVSYQLSDGSTLNRYYDRATLGELASLLTLDDNEQLAALRAALVSGDTTGLSDEEANEVALSTTAQAFASGSIFLADSNVGTPMQLNTTADARKSLLKALAADVKAQSSQQRYYSNKACKGCIMFSLNGASDAESFTYQLGNAVIFLDDSYTHTLDWLKDKGLLDTLQGKASDLGQLTVVRYDPHARTSGNASAPQSQYFMAYRSTNADDFLVSPEYGNRLVVEDKSQLKEVVSKLRTNYYMDGGGYLVCAFVKSAQTYTYFFLPAADAPDWLVRQAG